MRIEGFDVTYLSSYDGLPVKNHLPVELRERFKTENQWLESGYVLVVAPSIGSGSASAETFLYHCTVASSEAVG